MVVGIPTTQWEILSWGGGNPTVMDRGKSHYLNITYCLLRNSAPAPAPVPVPVEFQLGADWPYIPKLLIVVVVVVVPFSIPPCWVLIPAICKIKPGQSRPGQAKHSSMKITPTIMITIRNLRRIKDIFQVWGCS